MATIYGWSLTEKLVAVRKGLRGTAKVWGELDGLVETWDELAEAIQREFSDSTNSRSVYDAMGRRIKTAGESIRKYVQDMIAMGRRGELTERIIIGFIADGILDKKVRKAMLYVARNIGELK